MPFTFAHPAAVLPLRRSRRLVWSALVIGCVTPDLEYYVHLAPRSTIGHTAFGSVVFCIPAGLVLLAAFHLVLKRPAVLLLPRSHRRALWPLADEKPGVNAAHVAAVILSLLIGVWAHLVWDSFTHPYGWAVQRVRFLQHTVFRIGDFPVGVYKLLQQISTLGGLAALGIVYFKWWRLRRPDAGETPALRRPFCVFARLMIITSGLAVGSWLGIGAARNQTGFTAFQFFVVQFAIGAIVATACSLFLVGVAVTIFRRTAITTSVAGK